MSPYLVNSNMIQNENDKHFSKFGILSTKCQGLAYTWLILSNISSEFLQKIGKVNVLENLVDLQYLFIK